MSIDVTHFTPLASLSGGALIGAAAGLLILRAGRIMGASGIFAGALEARGLDGVWRLWLIAGVLAAPSLAHVFWNASPPVFSTSAPLLVLSGLLVGFGARLGVRLHERPRRLWPRAPFAAVIGGHDHFHGRRFRDCVHRSACVRLNRGGYSACATRSLGLSGSPSVSASVCRA
jgi:hypothetical protein